MLTKYILGVLALVFLAFALARIASGGNRGQVRTWLLIAGIFGAVSLWLFYQERA
jgi:hypothetical protein